jgi:RNA polymerase sigma factor (sigma-70 family)
MLRIPLEDAASSQSCAVFLCVSCLATLRQTARMSLYASVRMHAEDLVAGVIADIACGEFHNLPATSVGVMAFAKGVINNRARHLNREAYRFDELREQGSSSRAVVDPWACGARMILHRDVECALASLTPREREVARLHWLEQWSAPEIAERLGTATRTVKELLRRAAPKLRCALSRHRADGHARRREGSCAARCAETPEVLAATG